MNEKTNKPKDIYQTITDTIIESLEKGGIPWRKTWKSGGPGSLPLNLLTQKKYRGINRLLLWVQTESKGYSSPYWMTFKQCKKLGGNVKKGAMSTRVVFWDWTDKKLLKEEVENLDNWKQDEIDQGYKLIKQTYATSYSVFNLEQTEGIPGEKIPVSQEPTHQPIEAAEAIIRGYQTIPTVKTGDPAYSPSLDKIFMPVISKFEIPEEYYCTMFHECVHSTGHPSRLNRFKTSQSTVFGSDVYSFEELVAEIGASFLNADAGISPPVIENSAAYIKSWLEVLKNDKKFVLTAASQAQNAADYILGESLQAQA